MLRALIGFLCLCFSIPAQAKLGETVPQLIKRFGTSYTIESDALGKTYRFRSEKLSVDVLLANGLSVAETYFSDHPLTASGEPPNDIVRAVLKTNAPRARWVEIDAALFKRTTRCSRLTMNTLRYLDTRRRSPKTPFGQ